MGVADPYDARDLDVTLAEYVQHVLRHSSGNFVHGQRGHRLLWALVNMLLLRESQGKGFAVHRNVMRRVGGHLQGAQRMRRYELEQMLQDEAAVRQLVHQLMSVGQTVRSTPMSWAYESKKLS